MNPVFAEDIQILKISSEDETALIKTPDGKIQVLKVGDPIGVQWKVVEIVEGRVVIEQKTEHGTEMIIIRFDKGKQRVEKIRKAEDRSPVFYSPMLKGDSQPNAPVK
jgi:hypothetical protein